MIASEIEESGNICLQSGIWYEIEHGQLASVSRGEQFPLYNKKIAKWKLKTPATPVPPSEKQLKVFPWVKDNFELLMEE